MSTIKSLKDYPDISFIDNYALADLQLQMNEWFQTKHRELTGKPVQLSAADDRRLILQACAYYLYQGYRFVDRAGKMNLLKYSTGTYLDNLGALKNIFRMGARGASTTIRYKMKVKRTSATGIPANSRVSAGDGIYFATKKYAEIPVGETYVDVPAVCTTNGENTNNYSVGEISRMVDIVPYIDSVSNITEPQGGRDIETDDALRERIFLAPESYTTAGSLAAYKYFVQEYDPFIEDVSITSPSENNVKIVVILYGGEIPNQEYINGLTEYIARDDIKMLTDKITVQAPDIVNSSVDITYYINRSDNVMATEIQAAVNEAVEKYIRWQKTKIGRDINPDELKHLIRAAGAKRVEIKSPVFQIVRDDSIAVLEKGIITYGGIEDD